MIEPVVTGYKLRLIIFVGKEQKQNNNNKKRNSQVLTEILLS